MLTRLLRLIAGRLLWTSSWSSRLITCLLGLFVYAIRTLISREVRLALALRQLRLNLAVTGQTAMRVHWRQVLLRCGSLGMVVARRL